MTHHETNYEPVTHERERQALHPRIYVASLADYVNGKLHGRWIDATDDVDTVREEITAMLAASSDLSSTTFSDPR